MTTMPGTTVSRSTTTATQTRRTPTWRSGLTTVVVAAAVTTALAAVLRASGIELGVDAEPIPVAAFAQFVLISGVIGLVVARHVSRRAFVRFAVVMTALSCVPSLAWGTTVADKVGLVCTHLVAAAIIVPRYAAADCVRTVE